jgi:hypothetical protein
MASEKEANLAREQFSDYLRKLGAHGLTVDEVKRKGETSFALIAYFDQPPECLPKQLEVKKGGQTLEVPLIAKVMEKFQPE